MDRPVVPLVSRPQGQPLYPYWSKLSRVGWLANHPGTTAKMTSTQRSLHISTSRSWICSRRPEPPWKLSNARFDWKVSNLSTRRTLRVGQITTIRRRRLGVSPVWKRRRGYQCQAIQGRRRAVVIVVGAQPMPARDHGAVRWKTVTRRPIRHLELLYISAEECRKLTPDDTLINVELGRYEHVTTELRL